MSTGTDLTDPKNFGVLRPTLELERGNESDDEYRQRLSRHRTVAGKVLHTSKVPAALWRDWRTFEKAAHAHLRNLLPHLLHKTHGQDHVAPVILFGELNLTNPKRPKASFPFFGPTGVGKTEPTTTFTQYLFKDPDA